MFILALLLGAVLGSAGVFATLLHVTKKRLGADGSGDDSSSAAEQLIEAASSGTAKRQVINQYFLRAELESAEGLALRLTAAVRQCLCGYDPADPGLSARQAFAPVQRNSLCIFAKRAVLWAAPDDCWAAPDAAEPVPERCRAKYRAWPSSGAGARPTETQQQLLRALALFAAARHKIDAFLIAVPLVEAAADFSVADHGAGVNAVLRWLSRHDPAGDAVMDSPLIGKAGWRFKFAGEELFVTTFAPCYEADNSRYAYGANDHIFVLFQSHISFLMHGAGEETSEADTQWENPQTPRDRIRVNFRQSGMWYPVPKVPALFSSAHGMVPPLRKDDPWPQWWQPR